MKERKRQGDYGEGGEDLGRDDEARGGVRGRESL
jgi:hypothetical protein